jgi:diacylglycerol kinase (ATP)
MVTRASSRRATKKRRLSTGRRQTMGNAKPILAVVNPASANRTTGRAWPSISAKLKAAGLEHEAVITSRPAEATELTRKALRDGFRTIVAVGGDGTVNEVVNGFFEDGKWVGAGARLGLVSHGTGGDLRKTLGLPKNEDAAIERLVAGRTKKLDLGRAEFVGPDGARSIRHFINIGDLGLGGDTAVRVNRTTKVFGGKVSFLWGTLATVAGYRNKDLEIVIDGGAPIKGRMCMVVVANGQYFGGGMRIAPEAIMDDGIFDIVTVGDLGKLELLMNIGKVYSGRHIGHPKVGLYRGREVTVTSPQPALIELDGEQPGRTDVTFSILPGLLDVIA